MFAGKFGVSCAFAVIWIYSAELFSTDVRSNAMAMGSMSGRIGGIVSPFINEFYQDCWWKFKHVYLKSNLSKGLFLKIISKIKFATFFQTWKTIPWLPPLIFGSMCLLGGFVLFLLPETLGKPLLNTIDEANNYYARRASTISAKITSPNESARNIAS